MEQLVPSTHFGTGRTPLWKSLSLLCISKISKDGLLPLVINSFLVLPDTGICLGLVWRAPRRVASAGQPRCLSPSHPIKAWVFGQLLLAVKWHRPAITTPKFSRSSPAPSRAGFSMAGELFRSSPPRTLRAPRPHSSAAPQLLAFVSSDHQGLSQLSGGSRVKIISVG